MTDMTTFEMATSALMGLFITAGTWLVKTMISHNEQIAVLKNMMYTSADTQREIKDAIRDQSQVCREVLSRGRSLDDNHRL